MKEALKLIGKAQGLLESSMDADTFKASVLCLSKALEKTLGMIDSLQQEIEELNEYVSRIDDDLGDLELMHDDEAEEYDDYFGLDKQEDDGSFEDDPDEGNDDEPAVESDDDDSDEVRTSFRIWHGSKEDDQK